MADQKAQQKVGVLLGVGIFLLPIVFVWALLRSGHSALARALGFGWLALGILVVFAASQSNPSPSRDPVSAEVAEEVSSAPIRTAYVEPLETEERSAPDGPVVNRIYRGQRLDIYAVEGDWARVTAPNFDPRWVRLSDLTDTPPAEPDRSATASDPRLAALPGVGDYGHTEADIEALRAGALQLLNSGQCTRIDDANKSVNVDGVYFINCGESSNRFFRMEGGEPRFCGRSANAC